MEDVIQANSALSPESHTLRAMLSRTAKGLTQINKKRTKTTYRCRGNFLHTHNA